VKQISDSESVTEILRLDNQEEARALLGARDENLRRVRDAFLVRATMRGGVIRVEGLRDRVARSLAALRQMRNIVRERGMLIGSEVDAVIDSVSVAPARPSGARVDVFFPGREVVARSDGQLAYLKAMREHDLTLCVGPAGTGKTYLAVAVAVSELKHGRVRKIVLTRPAVEAGEHLGFLPGDMVAKVNPYLRPLYDALGDMMSPQHLKQYMENDIIEVVPLAFMRGRTLDHAFIILDEAQNCTVAQMKMFLTRLGSASRCVVTGDISQIDLPRHLESGLVHARRILRDVTGIASVTLTQTDIVRHPLVQKIVDAYETAQAESRRRAAEGSAPAGAGNEVSVESRAEGR